MAETKIEGLDDLNRSVADLIRTSKNLFVPFQAIGLQLAKSFRANFRRQPWPSSYAVRRGWQSRTLFRSGRLMRSIQPHPHKSGVVVSSGAKYAAIQQFGGDIKPKSKKFLTVPINKAAEGKRARDFENTFIRKGIILQKTGTRSVRALFALKKKVHIEARPFFVIRPEDKDRAVRTLSDYIAGRIG